MYGLDTIKKRNNEQVKRSERFDAMRRAGQLPPVNPGKLSPAGKASKIAK